MAQQPAPSAAAAVVVYEQKENEMQVWFRPARMHGHPERTPIKATITKDRGNGIVDLTFDDEGVSGNARAVPNALRLPRNVREQVAVWWDVGFEMDFQTAVDNSLKKKKDDPPPQPSPTPQADSAPSSPNRPSSAWYRQKIQETLDDDFQIGPAPQADSQPAPVRDEREAFEAWYITSTRASLPSAGDGWSDDQIRDSFMGLGTNGKYRSSSAQIASEGWQARAARAPADSVTAPAGATLHQIIAAAKELHAIDNPDGEPEWAALRQCEVDVWRARAERVLKAAAPTPPAQAADSVLEDADPLQGAANWLAEAHGQFGVAVLQGCLMIGYNRAKRLHDAAIAARKQGGAT